MHMIAVIYLIWIVRNFRQIDICIWFRIFGSKFNLVHSFYKHISWLNKLICG